MITHPYRGVLNFTPSLEPEGTYPLLSLAEVGTLPLTPEDVAALTAPPPRPSVVLPETPWFQILTIKNGKECATPIPDELPAASLFIERFRDEGRLCPFIRTALGHLNHTFERDGTRHRNPKLEIQDTLACARGRSLSERLPSHPDPKVRLYSLATWPSAEDCMRLLADPVEEVRMGVVIHGFIPYDAKLDDVLTALRHTPAAKIALIKEVLSRREWIEAVPDLAADPDPKVARAYRERAEKLIAHARRAVELVWPKFLSEEYSFDSEDFLICYPNEPDAVTVADAFDLLKAGYHPPPVSWLLEAVRPFIRKEEPSEA